MVLLIEDDLSVRRIAGRALERSGYTVWEAGNGQEALRLTHGCETPIRLTITGVSLPGMSGPELMDHVRVLRPGMPVLFTSGGELDDAVALRMQAGGAAFLAKPFTPDELTWKVQEVLGVR